MIQFPLCENIQKLKKTVSTNSMETKKKKRKADTKNGKTSKQVSSVIGLFFVKEKVV